MSKLLPKILSAAVFPAALMIVSKIAGIALVNSITGLDWGLQTNTGTLFSVEVLYPSLHDAVSVNSYSNLFMTILLAAGTGVLLFQSYFLNASHQNPKVIVKLIHFDFLLWLSESSTIFPRLTVWLSFLWLATIVCLSQSLQSLVYPWISIAALVTSIIFTWLASHTIEEELHTILPEHGTLSS